MEHIYVETLPNMIDWFSNIYEVEIIIASNKEIIYQTTEYVNALGNTMWILPQWCRKIWTEEY